MKYHDDITKSAEYLRLALPLMTKQATALHPVSYSVWYEFVSGINPGLKDAVNEILAKNEVLDEAATETLFRKHIAELDEESAQRITSGFQRVLAGMSQSVAQAGNQANQFGNSLEHLSGNLHDKPDPAKLESSINQLLGDTRNMQQAVATLQERLEKSQREAEALRAEVSRARHDALVDALTGLANRKAFDMALEAALTCQAEGAVGTKGLSLLIADIDLFKNINDTYGHLFGDKVLRAIGQILKQNVKGKDTAARFGGEEFVILLPDTQIMGAQIVAEAIRAAVEGSRIKRTGNNETISKITISLGIATYLPNESAHDFIGRADKALYASKEQGRNRVTTAGHSESLKTPPPASVH